MIDGFATLLLALAFLQPLHLLPWVSWHSEVLAFLGLLVFSMGLCVPGNLKLKEPKQYVSVPFAVAPWVLLALVVVIQCAIGRITFFGDALTLIFYIGLCVLALTIGFSKKKLALLPSAVLMVALVSVGIALTQALGVWNDLTWIAGATSFRRPGGNLSQPNQLATVLLMGLASLLYLFESRRVGRVLGGLILLVLVLGLALTESRSGLLGFVLMGAWILVGKQRAGIRLPSWWVWVCTAGLFALSWLWPTFISFFHAGGATSGADAPALNTSAGTRFVVWPQLMDAALQRPWFGWGLRQVAEAQNVTLNPNYVVEAFSYAHNIILDLLVGMGIPLTLLLVITMAVWTWSRVRAAKTLLAWHCLALVLPLVVHSMLEFPFAYAYFLLPAMLAIGILERELEPQKVLCVPRGIAMSLMGIFAALMAWSVVEYVQVEEDFRVARFEALGVGYTPSDYDRPRIVLLTQLDALLEGARIVPQPGMSAERLELSRRVAMRYPWTATQYRYAMSLALNGNPDEAVRQLKVIRAMQGEKTYEGVKARWQELALSKYPQLQLIQLP